MRPRVGARGKVVQDLEFYKKNSLGPPLDQLSLLIYMSSMLVVNFTFTMKKNKVNKILNRVK